MKQMHPVHEKIYDPELGPGASSTEVLRQYLDSPDAEHLFINFTGLEKLGINPQSDFDTPLGIYSYPLVQYFERYKPTDGAKIGAVAPYAGSSQWVNLIRPDTERGRFINDLAEDYTNRELDQDRAEIMRLYGKMFMYTKNHLDMFEKDAQFSHLAGGRFWNLTRMVADDLTYERGGRQPTQWNRLLRELGYSGFADRTGVGIIHRNEPFQSMHLSSHLVELVRRIENVGPSRDRLSLPEDLDTYKTEIAESLRRITTDLIQNDGQRTIHDPKKANFRPVLLLVEGFLKYRREGFKLNEMVSKIPEYMDEIVNSLSGYFRNAAERLSVGESEIRDLSVGIVAELLFDGFDYVGEAQAFMEGWEQGKYTSEYTKDIEF